MVFVQSLTNTVHFEGFCFDYQYNLLFKLNILGNNVLVRLFLPKQNTKCNSKFLIKIGHSQK